MKIIITLSCLLLLASAGCGRDAGRKVTVRSRYVPLPATRASAEPASVQPVSDKRVISLALVETEPCKPATLGALDKLLPPVCPYTGVLLSDWERFRSGVSRGAKWVLVDYGRGSERRQTESWYEGEKRLGEKPVSGAFTNIDMPADQHPDKPHNHLGLFKVYRKKIDYWSKEHDCPMPYSLFYHSGHALHACMFRDICRLGRPASHGCTRQNPAVARAMYNWAPIGTWVLIVRK